jgi:anthranilate phosphoribosyltransferase
MKGLSLDEIEGFRNALLNLSLKIELDGSNSIDLCGTGGDGKDGKQDEVTSGDEGSTA